MSQDDHAQHRCKVIVQASTDYDFDYANMTSNTIDTQSLISAHRLQRRLAFLLFALAVPTLAGGQYPVIGEYDCHFVQVPMRDGVRLNTSVCTPRGAHAPAAIVLTRTPYGIAADTAIPNAYKFLASDGYIFASQDIRGRFGSGGAFLMGRPLHDPRNTRGIDESTDAYDTVEWLTHNVLANNGRVGVLGVSYPGFLATMAGINPHPAVKAISPQAPMTDTWMGDDFFHQGAFRLSYGFEYSYDLEMSKDESVPLPIGSFDTYDWYLGLGSLATVESTIDRGKVPTWSAFVAHPAYDAYWQARAVQAKLSAPSVPTLTVGGWWDQEDRYGPLATYRALERGDLSHKNFLVMGPWNHGGWRNPARRMAIVDTGTSIGYLRDIEAPWFRSYLKDDGATKQPEAQLYDAGVQRWRSFDSWPVKGNASARSLYLHANGIVSFEKPSAGEAPFDQYVSDPAHPIPYRTRPIEQTYDVRGSRWRNWETEDQRFVSNRPDLVSWTSASLASDVTIAGDVVAHLIASTTGNDADWVVKLIDVFPDTVLDNPARGGYQLMVAYDIMRGRYRKSFTNPEAIVPNTPLPFTVDLHQQAYTFRHGHKIMVQIQSTWFPLYDRNPQTWVPNIFKAKNSDFVAQTHRIWHTPTQPSSIAVNVLR